MALKLSKVPGENFNKMYICYLWKNKILLKYDKKI